MKQVSWQIINVIDSVWEMKNKVMDKVDNKILNQKGYIEVKNQIWEQVFFPIWVQVRNKFHR